MQAQSPDSLVRRPRVGLVLSGGGAKGAAHVGVLRVLEKAGIRPDYIAGTSMGSIVGGLYAIGYTPDQLDSLLRLQDWPTLLSDKVRRKWQPMPDREKYNRYFFSLPVNIRRRKVSVDQTGFVRGQNLALLFSRLTTGYHDSISFDSLPIPFACVATDLVTYREHVFRSGSLSTAMRASMSIPAAFAPVRLDSMLLIDGGMRNNFPADVAREMGADFLIGVSVQSDREKTVDDFDNGPSVLSQLVAVNTENKYADNWAMTDLPIRVPTEGYGVASFSAVAIDSLVARGEAAAMQHWEALCALAHRLGEKPPVAAHRLPSEKWRLARVDFGSIDRGDAVLVARRFRLHVGDSLTTTDLEQAVTLLRTELFYNDVTYRRRATPQGDELFLDAGSKRSSELFLGVRYDNEEKVATQAHAVIPIRGRIPVRLGLTARLGKRSLGRVEATLNTPHFKSLTLAYTYRYSDLNVNQHGSREYNVVRHIHELDFGLMNLAGRNWQADVFARGELVHCSTLIGQQFSKLLQEQVGRTDLLVSYHAAAHYNSQDDAYFPTRGTNARAEYALYTDNGVGYKGHGAFSVVQASWQTAVRVNSRFTLQPLLCGRALFGRDYPLHLLNFIGGHFFGHYVPQQLPFAGIGELENTDRTLLVLQVSGMQRIATNNYVGTTLALGQHGDGLRHLFDRAPLFGYVFSYSYKTLFGPLGVAVGSSTRTHKPYFYVNLGFEF